MYFRYSDAFSIFIFRNQNKIHTRVDCILKFTNTYAVSRPVNYAQGQCVYHGLSYNLKIGGGKDKQSAMDEDKKRKTVTPIWRPVYTQAISSEDYLEKDVIAESEDRSQVQEVLCGTSINISNVQASDTVTGITNSTISSSTFQDNGEERVLEGESEHSTEKHSISVEVGASLIRFVKGKGGSTQKKIEEEMGVKIILPSSKKDDSINIAGISIDSVTRASEKIQSIIDEAIKSPSLDYSHFISLPLAIHPELVDKLLKFQNSILGNRDGCPDDNPDSDSNEDTSDNEDGDQQTEKQPDVAVELKVDGGNEYTKVNITKIPLVSYASKASKSSSPSDLGIDKSIFIKPKTFHLTVLMLKLWNKDRVNAAAEVLQNVSSKVMDALDNRPVSVRLKGLDRMRGSLAKARVLYAPVEEIGGEDRLLRACQVIIDAYVEAGLVLEKDVNQKLKLHATVMNARHRKRRSKGIRNVDSFDARGIFKQYGSEEWGQYLIPEVHLSQRFVFDENGYYHCCASIPFPESMQVVD